MTAANFEQLCRGLCELAGAPAPGLTPDAGGRVALELELQDVRVLLVHDATGEPDECVLLALFGHLPAGRELEAARRLLEINSQVHVLGYAFCRNAKTGEILLKQAWRFGAGTAVDLYQRVVSLVEGVRGWRQHHFIDEADEATAT